MLSSATTTEEVEYAYVYLPKTHVFGIRTNEVGPAYARNIHVDALAPLDYEDSFSATRYGNIEQ
jgi:hypothetical protein